MKYKVVKKYHFYAGHRNENLKEKCNNLHGHTYYVDIHFEFPYNEQLGITKLFSEIDDIVEPFIKQLDHSLLIHDKDPLYKYLKLFNEQEGENLKFTLFNKVTSAEHLAEYIYNGLKELPISKIVLQETKSSIVTYEVSR